MPKLSDWKWCIDFSKVVGQKEAKIPPQFFRSRKEARDLNQEFEGAGRVIRVSIREIKK
jgi:hypothetical protein